MPEIIKNTGSTARDFCMLERNLLSHLKLALLLSLLASSILLRARLVPEEDRERQNGGIPLASIEFGAAMLAIIAGCWEYVNNYKDLKHSRAFLAAPKVHGMIMSVVAVIVFGTCIALIAFD
ncbi:hypothetical protein CC1G_00921 [Coprinopsis cinerea okayama7|uniref:DUF202 domain-containing protein n=1 Tax=Coprinopsis cinerea (strain Okayama-7 / 130 / ATCC MYA-4618 / FGSC 9003) TaxID=240176 RepID=A8N946_COPC7|nr:hypothetical protein CC1G_00921 [Coprinopsis cinerea okayama7\|eukprot:XP_001831374.1 hypothetical protein CC1G_00921 [Coprinopsis cinerea okayama7\